ncbi:hypothetical protein V5799_001137 [Amblyomma americanum]|uniref:Sulfotransferase domain-containing protein n=1 Tax=Amblyomma americanum TaxID=6943 RepID=A0AAQ4D122_AMBAM
MDIKAYRYVDGLWMHKIFHEDTLRSLFAYTPRPDDVFIATYPKCGTTWTQYLVLNILRKGEPPKTALDFCLASPFLEMMGAEAAEKMVRPGLLKVHLPFQWTPYSANAKFHELFINGKLSWGDYFDHLLSWYEHRDSENVLFFTYEKLKEDTGNWVLKIADFLGEEYGEELRKDSALLRRILHNCSLENMKGVFNDKMGTLIKDLLNLPAETALKSLEVLRERDIPIGGYHDSENFIRKGAIGDWRAHFTPDQIEKTTSWIKKKTEGSDVMNCREIWTFSDWTDFSES